MVWIKFIEWLQSQDTLTLIVALGIIVYLVYKGVIHIPSIDKLIKKKKSDNPHINCIHYPDLGNRLSRLMVVKTEIDKTINLDILREQMNLVDQVAYDIRKKIESHFDKLLKNQYPNVKNVSSSVEHIAFENIAKLGERTIKDLFRFIMKENHIPNNEAEFIIYTKDRAINIINRTSEEFSVNWHEGLNINKEIHTEACEGKIYGIPNLKDEIQDQIVATLRRCRDIYNKKWEEIVRYDNEAATLFPEIYERVTKKDEK